MSLSSKVVEKFIKGDKKATEKVYLEYKNLMFFIIATYIPSKEDCDDILSYAFIKAIEHKEELKNPEGLKSYLSTIARNQALDFLKKQRNIPSSDIIDEIYSDDDRSNNILTMIEPLLTNKETIVVYLKVGFSFTWAEIANDTGIPESTARRLYESAKEKLRKELL